MKTIFRAIILIPILMACSSQGAKTEGDKKVEKNDFVSCFSGLDTVKTGLTIGCSNGTYKLISDKYVVHIKPDFAVQYDSCYRITIDATNASRLTELLIYDNDKSTLANLCADVTVTGASEPTRRLVAESGDITIGFSDPTEISGNSTHRTTIYIKNLVFVDPNTGEKIELKNELLWKVLDIGAAG